MESPHKFYLKHMNANTGYRASWDPGRLLKIGQVGKLDKFGVFSVYSSLEKEGIPIEVQSDATSIEMDYTSHESVSILTKLSGSAPLVGSVLTEAEAGFSFEFKGEKSVVFQTSGNKTHQLVNLAEIEKQIFQKYNDKNWDVDWLIVTQLVVTDSATIIISNSSNAKLELKAKGNVGTQNLKLTDVSLGLSVVKEQGSTLKYITQNELTPLYRVMGIRRPLFAKPQLGRRGLRETPKLDEFKIQDFDPGELE